MHYMSTSFGMMFSVYFIYMHLVVIISVWKLLAGLVLFV